MTSRRRSSKANAIFKNARISQAPKFCEYAQGLAREAGWEYGGPIAGHLIGVYPHEKIAGDKVTLYVHPSNHNRMRTPDALGRKRHWILEIHFVDRAKQIGGFYEELLTVGQS